MSASACLCKQLQTVLCAGTVHHACANSGQLVSAIACRHAMEQAVYGPGHATEEEDVTGNKYIIVDMIRTTWQELNTEWCECWPTCWLGMSCCILQRMPQCAQKSICMLTEPIICAVCQHCQSKLCPSQTSGGRHAALPISSRGSARTHGQCLWRWRTLTIVRGIAEGSSQ